MTKLMTVLQRSDSPKSVSKLTNAHAQNSSHHNRKIENISTLWKNDRINDRITSYGETLKEYMIKKHLMEIFSIVTT